MTTLHDLMAAFDYTDTDYPTDLVAVRRIVERVTRNLRAAGVPDQSIGFCFDGIVKAGMADAARARPGE